MRITRIDCTYLEVPFGREWHPAWRPNEPQRSRTYNIMRLETDEGIVGVHAGPSPDVVKTVSEYLVGKDPFAMKDHVQFLRRIGGFHAGGSAENALWDIIGKACGQPLYKLFGGTREKFLAYASTTEVGTPEQRAEDAVPYMERGYKAIKLRLHNLDPKDDIRLVEAVREVVGDSMEIMVDANQAHLVVPGPAPHWSLETATWVALELERLGVVWLEEPLSRYDFDNLSRLCDRVDIPIAGGESLPDFDLFKLALDRGAYDIIQPDAATSISRQLRLQVLAEAFHKPLVPHAGPTSVHANMHVMAVSNSRTLYLEFIDDPPVFPAEHFFDLVAEEDVPRVDKDGYVHLTQKPGLGFDWNYEAVKKFKTR